MASNALGKIGSKEAIRPLADILRSDPDWFARAGAAEGLAHFGDPDVKALLREAALHDDDERVGQAAGCGSR